MLLQTWYHMSLITACTVLQAVVKANSQSNGKGQNLTPWGSETPERISMKLVIYNQVASMPTHANRSGAATSWVVWANTWKNTCCGFFGIPVPFFALFFGSHRARTSGLILTICTSYDVFPPQFVPFGRLVYTTPNYGCKIPENPYFGAWICIFKLNVQNIKICILSKLLRRLQPNIAQSQILHSHKDHQILFVGGPNTRKTNPRWRTAVILKYR